MSFQIIRSQLTRHSNRLFVYSLSDLVHLMKQNLPDGYEPYDKKTIKNKLLEKFENDIIISTLNS